MSSKDRQGFLSRLAAPLAAVKRRLGVAESPAKTSKAAPATKPAAPPPVPIVSEGFTLALETMLTEDQGQFQTRLQVISLVEFHEAVGPKWLKVADKVMLIAEGVIAKWLGQGNHYGRSGQDFFVLVFRTIGPDEARRRAVAIAQELGQRLLGSQFVGSELPLALAAEITAEQALNPDGSLNLAAVHEVIGEMRSLIATEAGLDVDDDRMLSYSELPGAIPEAKQDLRRHLPPRKPPPRIGDWKAIPQAKPRMGEPAWHAMEIDRISIAAAPPSAQPMPGDARLTLAWRPSWVAEGEAIGAYTARILRLDHVGAAPLEGCLAYPTDGGATANALDRFAIAAAVREIRSPAAGAEATLAVVPVHWASMTGAPLQEVAAVLADLTPAVRASRLILELFGIPPDIEARDLARTIAAMTPLCRAVLVRDRLPAARARAAAAAGAAMVGLDLAELAEAERTGDQHLLAALDHFRAAVSEAGLPAYVWGVRRRPVVIGAVAGGFAMVNGPGLMKDILRPAKALPAPRSRFVGGA